ncbi:hypothetical protein [Bradyrhizobium liaoningense]|uniref:hypothetical protein n=1 Tax=Bradyrhizobium liaoningense TaxID=43992 RepID=UPI003908A95C
MISGGNGGNGYAWRIIAIAWTSKAATPDDPTRLEVTLPLRLSVNDLNLAIRFADRLVMLRHGRLAADGSRHEVVTDGMIRDIFEIDAVIGRADDGVPYLLPQSMRAAVSPPAS